MQTPDTSLIIGIDNGLSGGIVALSTLPCIPPIAARAIPTIKVTQLARKKTEEKQIREVDTRALWHILNEIGGKRDQVVVCFEECPFHADRAATMRSMAMSAGKVIATLEIMGFRQIVRVLSYDWHPVMLGSVPRGETKAYARRKAAQLWPDEKWKWSEKSTLPHDGMIDAALIAEYCRRKLFPSDKDINDLPLFSPPPASTPDPETATIQPINSQQDDVLPWK